MEQGSQMSDSQVGVTEVNPARSVYERIRGRILRSEIPPASRINIDQLARELEVSATPVREALKQLQGHNLVVQERGSGYSTTPLLTSDELREMFEFRLLLEPWAARSAAQDRLSNPGYALEREIDALEALVAQHHDVRFELIEHDVRFHDLIFRSVGNEVLHTAYTQAHCHLHAFRLYPNDYSGERTVVEHREIARAIRAREAEVAEAAMRQHLSNGYRRFAAGYAQPTVLPLLGESVDRPFLAAQLAL